MAETSKAFDKIYTLTKTEVYKYIAAKCRSIDDIDDIFQETYIGVYEYLKNGGEINKPTAFAKTVAKRTLSRYYSLLRRLKNLEERLAPVDMQAEEHSELVDLVDLLVMKKPAKVQRIFFMRHSLQLSFDEIAKRLDMKPNTVQKTYYRTVESIRRQLEKEELL